jgi:hypothetical protein
VIRRNWLIRRAWPAAAVVAFWLVLADDLTVDSLVGPDMLRISTGIAVASIAVAAAMWLLVTALADPASRRSRLLGAGGLAAAIAGVASCVPALAPTGVAALSGLAWIAGLRLVPRLTVVAWLLYGIVDLGHLYFPAVLVAIGAIAAPSPLAVYLRELVPRRVGSAP